ncbi:MAG: hypothetical protein HZY73_06320 [Micropruina sp.]|nr:MAG: hypothetical protein HZY73_06320 [Micropruina sp.]
MPPVKPDDGRPAAPAEANAPSAPHNNAGAPVVARERRRNSSPAARNRPVSRLQAAALVAGGATAGTLGVVPGCRRAGSAEASTAACRAAVSASQVS